MGRTDPVCVLLMADEKVGKTVTTGYGVGAIATFAGTPAGLIPLETVVGMPDMGKRCRPAIVLEDYIKIIDDVAANYKSLRGERPIVVADDIGQAAARTESVLRESKIGGWDLYKALMAQTMTLMTHAVRRRVGLVMSTHVVHPRAPTKENPSYEQGRPKMPTAELGHALGREPSTIIYLARSTVHPPANSQFLVGSGVPNIPGTTAPSFATADRCNVAPPKMYPALGELLRTQGYDVPRPKEVEALDKAFEEYVMQQTQRSAVECIAQNVIARTGLIHELIKFSVKHGAPDWALGWVITDLLGRLDLGLYRTISYSNKYLNVNFG